MITTKNLIEMILIVEIPHSGKPIVWHRETEDEIIEAIQVGLDQTDDFIEDESIESYLEWNAHDLSRQLVYFNYDDAMQDAQNPESWKRRHNGTQARSALLEYLDDYIPNKE